jgi:transposase
MSHGGEKREQIAQLLQCSYAHICNTIRKYCTEGLEAAITDKKREGRPMKLQQKQGAHLMALACSDPPEGRQCWTMQLLANKCIELALVEFISDETVRRFLKKSKSSHGKQKVGASLP